ncbi:non-homologous end-joining DNA ligase [Nocardia sp. NPDC020380]|uniref:non-homologous end-joining DNA ligase n=1 Tax=Nocardia sp. NPDC020380 TaxID=3364309 RepID=UPI0037BD1E47
MAESIRRAPAPMLAVGGAPPEGPGWAREMKWDGVRVIADCAGGECKLFSRNANDVSGSYPELTAALERLGNGRALTLDGEVIAQDAGGAPAFGLLQRRMHVVRPGEQLMSEVPVQLFAFDLLSIDGHSLVAEPYLVRRERLAELAWEAPLSAPPHWLDVDAAQLLQVADEHRLEGIVSKRTDSVYLPGRRSPAWVKTPLRLNTEVVVAGWTPGSGAFQRTFGSLVLGAHDPDGRFVFIGNVGTGFTHAARRVIRQTLGEIEITTSPFDPPPPESVAGGWRWVEPILVGDVEYREFAGERLRMPAWKGLRTDKVPAQVEVPPIR